MKPHMQDVFFSIRNAANLIKEHDLPAALLEAKNEGFSEEDIKLLESAMPFWASINRAMVVAPEVLEAEVIPEPENPNQALLKPPSKSLGD